MKSIAHSLHKMYFFGAMAVLSVLIMALALTSSAHAAPLSAADQKAVDDIITKVMKDGKQTGMSISLTGPRGDYEKAYGVSDRGKKKSLNLNDHFRIGSVTKTFISTAALIQIDKGTLKLTDTLDKYVSGVPNGNLITVKDLMMMRSGIYNYTDDTFKTIFHTVLPWWPYSTENTLQDIRNHASEFTPGTKFKYTNSNYILLGVILEKVTGKKIQNVITDDVIKPLGLTNTSYPTGTNNLPAPASRGYTSPFLGIVVDTSAANTNYYGAAGAIISTIPDMQKYTQKLRDGALLTPASHALRKQTFPCAVPYAGEGPTSLAYGYGNMLFGKWIGHNGSVPGFDAVAFYEPTSGATFVGMENISMSYEAPIFNKALVRVNSYLYPGTMETQIHPNEIPRC